VYLTEYKKEHIYLAKGLFEHFFWAENLFAMNRVLENAENMQKIINYYFFKSGVWYCYSNVKGFTNDKHHILNHIARYHFNE